MTTLFIYTQQQVDEAAGHPVSIGDRVEGLDWERRVQGRGTKVWWHKSVYEAFKAANQAIEVPKEQPESTSAQPESQLESQPESEVKTAKIVKKYANTRIVGTSLGDNVFVGKRGLHLKVGHVIDYKNNTMILKRLTSGKIVLIS